MMKRYHLSLGIKLSFLTVVSVGLLAGSISTWLYLQNPPWFEALTPLFRVGMVVLLFSLLTALILFCLTRHLLDRPLRQTISRIQESERRNYLLRLPVRSHDTIGELAKSYNKLMERITMLDAFRLETQRELVAAQQEIKYKAALEDKNRHLTLLYDLARALSGFLDSNDLYHEILAIVGCMLDYNELVLMLHNAKTKKLSIAATYGVENSEELIGMKFAVGEGVTGEAILKKKPIYVPNTRNDQRYLHYKGRKPEDVTFLAVPLLGPAGDEVIGILNVSRPANESFPPQERELVSAVAHLISLAIVNSQLYSQVKELSIRDALTKLYNRRHGQETIEREVKRAQRFGRSLALLMIDIDHFKQFNDRHGHPEGDKTLAEFASLLKASVRDVDYVARWGGEEFIILLPNTNLAGSMKVAEKIRRNVRKHPFPNRSTQPRRRFTVSIGVSVLPDNAQDVESLVLSADGALYDAKGAGRDCIVATEITEASQQAG